MKNTDSRYSSLYGDYGDFNGSLEPYRHIGITGTRDGMNEKQRELFLYVIQGYSGIEKGYHQWFHHGDCVGVDSETHDIIEILKQCHIEIHPPIKNEFRAFKNDGKANEKISWPVSKIHDCKGYLERNRDIVNASELMIAIPKTDSETKGGTWYTINYAKKIKKPLTIIYPSGKIEKFEH